MLAVGLDDCEMIGVACLARRGGGFLSGRSSRLLRSVAISARELAEEILQRFGAGGVFLDVDACFFAQDQAEQRFEDAAAALCFAGFASVAAANEETARNEWLDAL